MLFTTSLKFLAGKSANIFRKMKDSHTPVAVAAPWDVLLLGDLHKWSKQSPQERQWLWHRTCGTENHPEAWQGAIPRVVKILDRQVSLDNENWIPTYTKAVSYNIAYVRHSAMPCISCAHLTRWGNIQKEISERSLQTIERKVKNVERDDRKYDGCVINLSRGQ